MAASDERAKMLEVFQIQAQEGPCQDCFRTGSAVMNADLREAHVWPLFAPHAVAAGFRSVHAFPLRLRKRVIGALNLFGNDVGGMRAGDMRVIQALADIATIGLLQERAIRRGEVLTGQLQSALNSRVVIEQAKGVLAELHGCSTDDASEMLRPTAIATKSVWEPSLRPSSPTRPAYPDSPPLTGHAARLLAPCRIQVIGCRGRIRLGSGRLRAAGSVEFGLEQFGDELVDVHAVALHAGRHDGERAAEELGDVLADCLGDEFASAGA